MTRFGIEIELTVTPERVQQLMEVLVVHKSILIKNTKNKCYLYRDPSLVPDEILDYGFEVKTKKLDFNEENMQLINSLFIDLTLYASANDSCGIHVHMSKQKYTKLMHYALMYEYLKLGYANGLLDIDGLRMSDDTYANINACKQRYLYRVNTCIKSGKKYIVPYYNVAKTELYKVHDLNTIEYRGLRHHFKEASIATIMKGIYTYLTVMDSLNYDPSIKKVFRHQEY